MLEELQRRNYSDSTTRYYLQAVAAFAKHYGKPPDRLGPDELRSYQAYLLKERKLAVGTVIARVAAWQRHWPMTGSLPSCCAGYTAETGSSMRSQPLEVRCR